MPEWSDVDVVIRAMSAKLLSNSLGPDWQASDVRYVSERRLFSADFTAVVQANVSCVPNPTEAGGVVLRMISDVIQQEKAAAEQRSVQAHLELLPKTRCPPLSCSTCAICLLDSAPCDSDDECCDDVSVSSSTDNETVDSSDDGEGLWTRLPCSHHIHSKCLSRWAQERPSCPLCRVAICAH